MTRQWKDKYVIYRLGGSQSLNLRQRAGFSSLPHKDLPQPVDSLPPLSLFYSVREGGLFYNFVIRSVLGAGSPASSLTAQPSPPPPLTHPHTLTAGDIRQVMSCVICRYPFFASGGQRHRSLLLRLTNDLCKFLLLKSFSLFA